MVLHINEIGINNTIFNNYKIKKIEKKLILY